MAMRKRKTQKTKGLVRRIGPPSEEEVTLMRMEWKRSSRANNSKKGNESQPSDTN